MAAIPFERRQFIKLLGWGGAALAAGCAPKLPDLIPYLGLQENLVPGQPTWFATTCRQCPSGCGVIAKNVDGRVIKLEGNPLHPLSGGKLCPRGQAALTGLYSPDRIRQPLRRLPDGQFQPLGWPEALGYLREHLQRAGGRIAFLTPPVTGTLRELIRGGLVQAGADPGVHIIYDPFSYEPLVAAHRGIFGQAALPTLHLDQADLLVSLGADFLESWLAPVEYARRFALFHEPKTASKGFFVYVGPRQSMTAANADHVVYVAPGTEYLAAAGILSAWLEKAQNLTLPAAQRQLIQKAIGGETVQSAARRCGAAEEELRLVAARLQQARRPLALASGNALLTPNATAAAIAADVICTLSPESLRLVDFGQTYTVSQAAPAGTLQKLTERMRNRQIDLLLLWEVNPVFTLPRGREFAEAMRQVPQVIAFSTLPNETTQFAELHLPTHHFLEEWGDYQPKQGVTGLIQPTMGPLFQSASLADILIAAGFSKGAQLGGFRELVMAAWRRTGESDDSFTRYWVQSLRQGGRWQQQENLRPAALVQSVELPPAPAPLQAGGEDEFRCVVYPTIQFHDGSTASSPWLQELPDPITQITWGGWVEMHPDDLVRLGLHQNDLLQITSPHGSIQVPVFPIYSVPPMTVAVPVGQGHTHCGRFADGLPGNPLVLLPDPNPGGPDPADLTVKLKRLPGSFPNACTSGNLTDANRHFIQLENYPRYQQQKAAGHRPEITWPLPLGYHPEVDVNSPHVHGDYRWAMAVDLDRCIGCGACVVACYAENNVAFVGRDQVLKGREMSWIRVQRYFQKNRRPAWLVMLCQHCDSAPCESVCPIYAPQHSIEGLNNQVYNRCFGTRFCSQNDPYKVRRFNWFTWTRPDPLNRQLNPDVTVRQKGIMEKCSFCIQRIVQAKTEARNAGRLVRDGDFTTACAQTCPTDALIFGSLLDKKSRVYKLFQDARAYQVLHHLNTKPAVVYLKRLTQEL